MFAESESPEVENSRGLLIRNIPSIPFARPLRKHRKLHRKLIDNLLSVIENDDPFPTEIELLPVDLSR